MKRYICMRYRFGDTFEIATSSPPTGEPGAVEDLIPKLASWDEAKAVLAIPAHDPATVVVPVEARLVAVPQGTPVRDPVSLVESTYPQTVVALTPGPEGASVEIPIPTNLDPATRYIGQTVFGYRD